MTSMIDRACMAAWPDYETVTDEMRSRMRAVIAAIGGEMSDPVKSPDPLYDPTYGDAVVLITDLRAERDRLRAALEEIANAPLPKWACDIARRALEGK